MDTRMDPATTTPGMQAARRRTIRSLSQPAFAGRSARGLALLLCIATAGIASIGVTECCAATRRALLVGINTYTNGGAAPAPSQSTTDRGWFDLDGAVNDAQVLREILVSRYGFEPRNVHVLLDGDATRDSILGTFRKNLIDAARPGDVCVFFYAGHGSQAKSTVESDSLDETVVPADARRGAADIRDKEWKRLFNDVLDRGAKLTVFFDSCHSGSISRGLGGGFRKSRFILPDRSQPGRGFGTNPDTRPQPDERGALIFSAAQEFQRADETQDGAGVPHGVFSLALAKTLRTMPVDETAENVFLRVKAIMQSEGTLQEPALLPTGEKRFVSVFGAGIAAAGRTQVAVQGVGQGGSVVLQAGTALGLCPGCEFMRVDRAATPDRAGRGHAGNAVVTSAGAGSSVRLRVESVEGLNRCTARIVEGDPSAVAIGDLVEIDRWIGCDEPFLRGWVAPTKFRIADLQRIAADLGSLRKDCRWIDDPTQDSPTHVVSWDESTWKLKTPDGKSVDLGIAPTASAIRPYLKSGGRGAVRFFLQLPPPAGLADSLRLAPANPRSPIRVTTDRSAAHYMLVGRARNDHLEYAWLLPGATQRDSESSPLPAVTNWCLMDGSSVRDRVAAEQLADLVVRLGKVRMWLQMDPPPDNGRFPYQLALVNTKKKSPVPQGSVVYDQESLDIVIRADEKKCKEGVFPRYVYVFAVDGWGRSTMLWPLRGDGNGKNCLPRTSEAGDPICEDTKVCTVTVTEPFAVDTYVLLSTKEALPDPDVLENSGVVTRGARQEDPDMARSPLARLVTELASGTRGIRPRSPTPVDWSIQRFSVRSAPRP